MQKQIKYMVMQLSSWLIRIILVMTLLFNTCFARMIVIANQHFPEQQLSAQQLLALYSYSNDIKGFCVTPVAQSEDAINTLFFQTLGVDAAYISRTRAQAEFSAPLSFNPPVVLNSAQQVLEAVAKHPNYIGYLIVSPEQLLPDDVKIVYQAPTSSGAYQHINAPKTNNNLQSGDICYLQDGKKVCLS